jgi:feruloyl esterase
LDGLEDRLLQDPRRCSFDPAVLECKGPDSPSCLTPPQVQTARAVYATTRNPKTGREVTGLFPGSELGWATWGGPAPLSMGLDHFRYVVFEDPAWDYHTFDFDAGIVLAEQRDNGLINALDPNLTPFFARGGKLLQYHGWADPQISPGASVQYYQSVVHAAGGAAAVQASYRLFMVPGMAHCGGGQGPNSFDMVSALEQWVEKGSAPDRIIASHLTGGKVDRTRPLCPYPQLAKYTGTGSPDEAANFVCSP